MANQQAGNEKRSLDAAIMWEQRRPEIVYLYHDKGYSQAQLAQHYQVAQSAIYKVLKRLGVAAKPKARSGAANGRYKDGSQSTLYRKLIAKRACKRCGSREMLLVHHRDGNHRNDALTNLEVLCSPCHSSHHKKEYWRIRNSPRSD